LLQLHTLIGQLAALVDQPDVTLIERSVELSRQVDGHKSIFTSLMQHVPGELVVQSVARSDAEALFHDSRVRFPNRSKHVMRLRDCIGFFEANNTVVHYLGSAFFTRECVWYANKICTIV